MYVLGIETSCDETAAAVVKDGRKIFSNEISSSLNFHKKYGGVVPEIASRMQLETIAQVADSAVKKAGVKLKDIGLICVTTGPGLLGSLLVGVIFAKSISSVLGVPLLGVNHLHGHIYASFLNAMAIKMPFIALVVSGGHTNLFYVEGFDRMRLMGSTLDDACGEAFDKVAKILNLGFPGGPLIEQLARKGNPEKIKFHCSGTKRLLDFSFSGIKTAVLYSLGATRYPLNAKKDIAASFQEAVVETLIRKTLMACELEGVNRVVVGGGVAANNRLREKFYKKAKENRVDLRFPSKGFCTDNAAMVAGLGYRVFKKGYKSDLDLNAESG